MTSQQVLWTGSLPALLVCLLLGGCMPQAWRTPRPVTLQAPYDQPQLWAVAPLRNEAGSRHADGVRLADHLAAVFEEVGGLQVVPVGRVLAAMAQLQIPQVASLEEAMTLGKALGVDGLVVGSIAAYDPYDPPSLGVAIELYTVNPVVGATPDLRRLSRAATEELSRPSPARVVTRDTQPLASVSGHFAAADPQVREALQRYAHRRGSGEKDEYSWRLYRVSMDLYSQFVSHELASRLIWAEHQRLAPPPSESEAVAATPPPPSAPVRPTPSVRPPGS